MLSSASVPSPMCWVFSWWQLPIQQTGYQNCQTYHQPAVIPDN